MNVFYLIWNKFIKCSECLFLSSVEWKCRTDYTLHVVQCGLRMTACVRKRDQDREKGSGWEKAGMCECTGGWRTALTGDSWWGIIRICTLATKHPSPADETDAVHLTPLWILQCGFLQIVSTHTKSKCLGAIPPTSLPQASTSASSTVAPWLFQMCYAVCVCTYSPWVCVCVCAGWRSWPSSLSPSSQTEFLWDDIWTETSVRCPSPASHHHFGSIQDKCLAPIIPPPPLPPHTAAYHTNGSEHRLVYSLHPLLSRLRQPSGGKMQVIQHKLHVCGMSCKMSRE